MHYLGCGRCVRPSEAARASLVWGSLAPTDPVQCTLPNSPPGGSREREGGGSLLACRLYVRRRVAAMAYRSWDQEKHWGSWDREVWQACHLQSRERMGGKRRGAGGAHCSVFCFCCFAAANDSPIDGNATAAHKMPMSSTARLADSTGKPRFTAATKSGTLPLMMSAQDWQLQ